ncbi:MAG TPA: Ig-like domain-containing protein, partial [Terriglobales bacterium]|nr:Ig-like domain-containing protein [Terriglobales bacterium]
GLAVSSGGVITWTPTEAQGPSTNLITVRVTDNGAPALSDQKTFNVVVAAVDLPPQISITSPKPLSVFCPNSIVEINAQVVSDDPVARVEFYADSELVETVTDPPYTIQWRPTVPRDYALSAKVVDAKNITGTSDSVKISVTGSPECCKTLSLAVSNIGPAAQVLVGTPFNYTLFAQHFGECAGVGVVVTDHLPAAVVFVSAQADCGTWEYTNGVVTWQIGRMESGAQCAMELTVVSTVPGNITNCAGITAINNPFPDDDDESCSFPVIVTGCRLDIQMMAAGGCAEITLRGESNQEYDIETCDDLDLHQWTSRDLRLAGPTAKYIDCEFLTRPYRYYRAKQR